MMNEDRIKQTLDKASKLQLESHKFVAWWKDDKERRLCTLEQAIGAYISTFPGRLHALLVELLENTR